MSNINPNLTNRNKFRFQINFSDTEYFEFFAKAFTFGGITLGVYQQPTPIRYIELPGDSFQAEDCVVDFFIDEDWKSYKEIFRWMKRIKSSSTMLQNPNLIADATLTILNTKYRNVFNIIMKDVWPYSLTTLNLDTDDDSSPLLGQVLLKVNDYDIIDSN